MNFFKWELFLAHLVSDKRLLIYSREKAKQVVSSKIALLCQNKGSFQRKGSSVASQFL